MKKEGATIYPNMGWSFWLGDPEATYVPFEEDEEDEDTTDSSDRSGLERFLSSAEPRGTTSSGK